MIHVQTMEFVPDILELLLENGADLEARSPTGETILHYVGDPDWLRALQEAGADLEARNTLGWTPMMSHAPFEHTAADAIYTLLDLGADPHARAEKGETVASLLPEGPRFDDLRRRLRGTDGE